MLCGRWDHLQVNQVGSHIILQTEIPQHHRISIPGHRPLRIGTLNAILRQVAAAKGVRREDVLATLN
jgi:HicA toxin of bacterial toxin-antitoxin,